MRCDLLSNLYLWTIGNNQPVDGWSKVFVVIYFQICIFEPLETTHQMSHNRLDRLWFTFKFVSLNHWKQRNLYRIKTRKRCDLLSNLYLWTIGNNQTGSLISEDEVVIYFQICIFEPLETTGTNIRSCWCSCDLLSNLYLWTIGNNRY